MTETGTETDSRDGMAPRSGGCPGFARRPPERRRHRERRAVDQRDGYARTDQPRLPERAVACMDAGSAAVRALGPEMTQRMCSEARLCGHLVTMEICQDLNSLWINGLRFSSSCVVAPNCTLAGKRIAGVLSRPSYGLIALGPNGDCCQPNTGTGTPSTNDSPVGLTKASGHKCINIAATTRIWNT